MSMTSLQIFTSPSGVQIRTTMVDGTLHFVGKDAAEALGHTNAARALRNHVDEENKGVSQMTTPGGIQTLVTINEAGLYELALRSETSGAREFKKWVTSEVLPAIRRTGGYMVDRPEETPEETMARALSIAADTLARREARIAQLEAEAHQTAQELAAADAVISTQHAELMDARPKALFADAVSASDSCILIGELAKLLRQNGVEIGQNRLFDWMRKNRYLTAMNRPTQRSMERGLFKLIERSVLNADGTSRVCFTTKVTGKGQQYFINHFLTH